jgi:hypothetical protein
MAQHVRVKLHVKASSLARALDHRLKAPKREWRTALAHEDEGRPGCFPSLPAQGSQLTTG